MSYFNCSYWKDRSSSWRVFAPHGVAIDEETHQIFVANNGNDRVDIFSETGEFISQLGDGQLFRPYGIILSDPKSRSIRVFSPEGNLIHTIGREGPQQGMLALPYGVAIAPNGRLVCMSSMNYGLQISY